MLNIAGISPAPKSIPLIPKSLESIAIPKFRAIPCDSGIAQPIRIIFKSIHVSRMIIILLIPELDGIIGNSALTLKKYIFLRFQVSLQHAINVYVEF